MAGRVSLFPIIHLHTRFPYPNLTPTDISSIDRTSFEIVSKLDFVHSGGIGEGVNKAKVECAGDFFNIGVRDRH